MFYDREGRFRGGRRVWGYGKILRYAQDDRGAKDDRGTKDDRGAKDDDEKETLWRDLHLLHGHFKKY